MSDVLSYKSHFSAIFKLGLPLVGGQLAQFAIGVTDTIMLGWYSVEALAAQILANTLLFMLFLFGSGFGWAVSPVVATASAQNDVTAIRRSTRMGLWWVTLFAALSMPALWFSQPILLLLGQEDILSADAQVYLRIAGWGLAPALWAVVLRSYLSGLERTQIVFWISCAAAVANGFGNYALIFGNWGAPELGIAGAAISSLIVHFIMALGLIVYAVRTLPDHQLFVRFWRMDPDAFAKVGRMGLPIGLTTLAEVGLFSAVAIMMGWLGVIPLAAHGIALQITSATFMVHLGLAQVATVRAGAAIGRNDEANLRRGAFAVLFMSAIGIVLTVIAFVGIPEVLVGFYLDQSEPNRDAILSAGVTLLMIAALFQLADAAQVVALGLLRGAHDTKVPMIVASVGYWFIGLPAAYVLGFSMNYGGVGVWFGLVIGLAFVGAILMARFWGWKARL